MVVSENTQKSVRIGEELWFRRSLMNNGKKVSGITEHHSINHEGQCPSTTTAIERSERKFEINLQTERLEP